MPDISQICWQMPFMGYQIMLNARQGKSRFHDAQDEGIREGSIGVSSGWNTSLSGGFYCAAGAIGGCRPIESKTSEELARELKKRAIWSGFCMDYH